MKHKENYCKHMKNNETEIPEDNSVSMSSHWYTFLLINLFSCVIQRPTIDGARKRKQTVGGHFKVKDSLPLL